MGLNLPALIVPKEVNGIENMGDVAEAA